MYEVIVLFALGLVWIFFASVQDLKSREVANWINFSLIIFALGFRFFYSLFSEDFSFLIQGLLGLVIFFIVGILLYYSRMFAGGDTKLMISLGTILPFSGVFAENLKIFILFIILFLFSGAIYGLIMTLILSFKNFKKFKKEFLYILKNNKRILFSIMSIGILLLVLGFFETLFFPLGILVFIFPYFYFYAKAVDNSCMVREMNVKDLTEGEWLYKPIKTGKKIIKPTWDGLTKQDIRAIRKKYKKIKIKQGIVFIPVFLIAFLILSYIWKTGLWNTFW
ncbi:MAG: A24 family peptidase [archaeon]